MLRFFLSMLLSATFFSAVAQSPTPISITLEPLITGLDKPLGVVHANDHRIFILEQHTNNILVYDTTGTFIATFLDLSSVSQSSGFERGLLGMAFHPNYATNGKCYVSYTNTNGDTEIAQYNVSGNPNIADATSGQLVLNVEQPYNNHNGGNIVFGEDEYLYIGLGDGGSGGDPENSGQDGSSLLGKMLRIDVDALPYTIPASNPFVNDTSVVNEAWAVGLRNPWRFSFDRSTGDLWIADVGQNLWEEINYQEASFLGGANYGWRCYEGNATYNTANCGGEEAYDFPLEVFSHDNFSGFCSITGGYVYRGSKYPGMQGYYLFGDYCYGGIHVLSHTNGSNPAYYEADNTIQSQFTAFGEDASGELYVTRANGTVYRITEDCGGYDPAISLIGGELQSDVGESYYWYKDGVLLPGATASVYQPLSSGAYACVVENTAGCARLSNAVDVFVSIGVGGCTYLEACNYDSTAEVDDGSCDFSCVSSCIGDINADDVINTTDLLVFLSVFGSTCN